MGDVGCLGAAGRFCLFETARHLVEARRQPRDLVLAMDIDAGIELALRDDFSGASERLDG